MGGEDKGALALPREAGSMPCPDTAWLPATWLTDLLFCCLTILMPCCFAILLSAIM